ncbi:MAG: cupin domain-containing protein [Pseudomonadota bacterium]
MAVKQLEQYPVHLGADASVIAQPAFTGDMAWYEAYGQRHGGDGIAGRLVSCHTFREPWDSWEMHPSGDEMVFCVSGEITLHQESPSGETRTVVLQAGDYVVNPPGVWHTADVAEPATALFITVGEGTTHRPR